MIKKIKDMLGIEGVKIAFDIDEHSASIPNEINGKLIFTSQSKKNVNKIIIKVIEKYKRGRSDAKLINDYLLGSLELEVDFIINQGESKEVSFKLPYNHMKSEFDRMQEGSLLAKPFILLAKKLKNVSSEYRIEATAFIKGTKFHPIAVQKIEL